MTVRSPLISPGYLCVWSRKIPPLHHLCTPLLASFLVLVQSSSLWSWQKLDFAYSGWGQGQFSFFFPLSYNQQEGGWNYQKNAWSLTLPLEICHQEWVLGIFLSLPVVYLSQRGDHFKVSVIALRTHICYIFKKTKLVFEILFLVLCLGTLSLSIEADRSDDFQCCFLFCSFCLLCVALLCFPEFYSVEIVILYHI